MSRELLHQAGTTGPATSCRSRGRRAVDCLADNVTIDSWYLLLSRIFRSLQIADLTRKMRRDWDRRARVNAVHFVNGVGINGNALHEWNTQPGDETAVVHQRHTPRNNLGNDCPGRPVALETTSACSLVSLLPDLLPSEQSGQPLTQTDCVQGRFGDGFASGRTPALGKQRNPAVKWNEAL